MTVPDFRGKVGRRLRRGLAALWFDVVIAAMWLLRPVVRLRLTAFRSDRLGHFITETDLALRMLPAEPSHGIPALVDVFVMPPDTCNEQLRSMYLRAVDRRPTARALDCRTSIVGRLLLATARHLVECVQIEGRLTSFYCGSPHPGGIDILGLRPSGRPYLAFTETEERRAWESLVGTPVTPRAPLACLHIRDSSYLRQAFPSRDWSYHDYRNPDPATYLPAITRLLDLGFVVARMGSVVEGPLDVAHDRYFDYATWPGRSPLLDVFLYANASMAISGSASGIDQLGCAFNTPVVMTNFVPLEDPRYAVDKVLMIPCLLREGRDGPLLPLSQMLQHAYGSQRRYEAEGLSVVYNTPQEITDAIAEMASWIGVCAPPAPAGADDKARQEKFWAWADACGITDPLPPGPWRDQYYRGRVGAAFLRGHEGLLLA